MNGSGKFFYGFSDISNFTVFKCLLCCVGLYIFSLSISSLWWLQNFILNQLISFINQVDKTLKEFDLTMGLQAI